jgi:dinuclear metal center YbgI/SA1388 family protein
MEIKKLMDYTEELLQVSRFPDYCPNGLQVQGKKEVDTVVSGVTASMALLEAAVKASADLVLVHHGYFWKGEDACLKGIKRDRLKYLLEHDLNMAAFHLPLDAHPEYGNNVQLGRILGVNVTGLFGDPAIIAHGTLDAELELQAFAKHVHKALNREPFVLGQPDRKIKRVGWCTGAAQDYFEQAIELGVDVFISGEISEQTTHLSRESGVAYIAAGHHATERYGIQALGQHLAGKFGLQHIFIDIDNPV